MHVYDTVAAFHILNRERKDITQATIAFRHRPAQTGRQPAMQCQMLLLAGPGRSRTGLQNRLDCS